MSQITLTIDSVEVKTREPYATYAWQSGEHTEMFLSVKGTTEDGKAIYFNTPACERVVSLAPGIAIVIYHIENGAKQWMVESDGSKCATPGQKNENTLLPLVSVGDIVTINGRMSKKISRIGNEYYQATHVKRVV